MIRTTTTRSNATPGREDWYEVICRVMEGDQLALLRLGGLINCFLARWNAYDLRHEWDDLAQEVVIAAVMAIREGRLRERGAVVGWLRSTARFKFVDRLRSHAHRFEDEALPWDEIGEGIQAEGHGPAAWELRGDLDRALDRIPERRRQAVLEVYVYGKTYDEVVAGSGTPLGTLKRYLRDGLAQLRWDLQSHLAAE